MLQIRQHQHRGGFTPVPPPSPLRGQAGARTANRRSQDSMRIRELGRRHHWTAGDAPSCTRGGVDGIEWVFVLIATTSSHLVLLLLFSPRVTESYLGLMRSQWKRPACGTVYRMLISIAEYTPVMSKLSHVRLFRKFDVSLSELDRSSAVNRILDESYICSEW